MRDRRLPALLLAMLTLLAVAACGDDEPAARAAGATGGDFPVTVETSDGPLTLESRPERIVSLSPSLTETVFAVGAGDQVVAVDEYSTYPPGAPRTSLSGFQLNVEAVIAHEPDLVVVSGGKPDALAGLRAAGVDVAIFEAVADLDEAIEQIRAVGALTGHADEGDEVADRVRDEIDEIIGSTPRRTPPVKAFYELTPDFTTVTSRTFIGSLLGELGLENIADAAAGAGDDYPTLSEEQVVTSDPDLVLLTDAQSGGQSPATVAARPGWGGMRAVRNGDVVALDEDVASRWGPRLPELLRDVADAVSRVVERG